MIIYCEIENQFDLNAFLQKHIFTKGESVSLCDVFKQMGLESVKYVFNYNPCIFINFSGTISDLLYYLHNVLNIHYDMEVLDNQLILTFKECKIHKYYSIESLHSNTEDLIKLLMDYTPHVFELKNGIISIKTSCVKHQEIQEIINVYNQLGKIYMDIEFSIIDIHSLGDFDDNCLNFLKNSLQHANGNNTNINIVGIISEFSQFLTQNKKGRCEVTSHTSCTLFNNSSIEVNTGLDDSARHDVHKKQSHDTGYSRNKSYVKLKISGQCHNTEFANLKFIIQNKCEISKDRASISESLIETQIQHGQICYLMDRNGGSLSSQKASMFSSEKKATVRTVLLVKVTIKEKK